MSEISKNNANCLILAHVKQPYYEFHINAFQPYFLSVEVFYYTEYFLEKGLKQTEEKIADIINDQNIGMVILWQWPTFYGLTLEFLASLREKTFTVLWLFDDDVFFHSHGKFNAQVVDIVVTTDYFGKLMYEQLQISSLYYLSAYDKKLYKRKDTKKEIDVSFVGSLGKADRREYMEFLQKNGIKIEVFGDGAGNGYLSEEDMVNVFNRSKINLNFTKIAYSQDIYEDNPMISRVRQNKGRIVEIGLTGSFCLTENAPPLKYLVDVKKHIGIFRTKEELLEKINFYLAHEKERQAMEDNFYSYCLEHYEKEVYFRKIFDQIEQLASQKSENGYKRFKQIEKNYYYKRRESAFFFEHGIRAFIKKRNIRISKELLKEAFKYGWIHFMQSLIYAFMNRKSRFKSDGISE